MARTPDLGSKRQMAFKVLDGMRNIKREIAIATIKVEFALGKRYADTIYATHRQMGKDAGLYTTVYRIIETAGVPRVSSREVFEPPADACTSVEDAKVAYLDVLVKKIDTVNELHN